jgi:hypothetical protein
MRIFNFLLLLILTSGFISTYGQGGKFISTTWWTHVKDFDELFQKKEIILSDSKGSSTFEFRKNGDLIFWTDRRCEFDSVNNFREVLISPYYGTYELKRGNIKIQFAKHNSKAINYKFVIDKDEIRLIKRNE